MSDLSSSINVTQALAYATGTASRNGTALDMTGYDGVIAIVTQAAIHNSAVGDAHWEQGLTSGGSYADLLGTAIVVDGDEDDEVWVMDLYRPLERYVHIIITKDTSNAQAESVVYIQYKGKKSPVSNAGADEYELQLSPAEGTK